MKNITSHNEPNDEPREPKSVIIVSEKFKLTPLRGAMIAFYLRTMIRDKKFKNDTEFILSFSQTFKVSERGCWIAWKQIKPIVTQMKASKSPKLYFAYRLDGFDFIVRKFFESKGLL